MSALCNNGTTGPTLVEHVSQKIMVSHVSDQPQATRIVTLTQVYSYRACAAVQCDELFLVHLHEAASQTGAGMGNVIWRIAGSIGSLR